MKKAFKSLKLWKSWIVVAFIAGILLALCTVVYAGVGLVDHKRWVSNTALTASEWDQIMHQIDSLGYVNTN